MLARQNEIATTALPFAAPFTTMVHIRTFTITSGTFDDHMDASNLAMSVEGPALSAHREDAVIVLEQNAKAVEALLKKAGIAFTHETSWVPDTEWWIAGYSDEPAAFDEDGEY